MSVSVSDSAAKESGSRASRLKSFLKRNRTNTIRIVSLLAILLVWEIYGRQTSPILFTYPSAIAQAMVDMVVDGTLLEGLRESLFVLGFGLGLGIVGGVTFGLAIGRSRTVSAITDIPVVALYATPMVALVPVLVLWFGFGTTGKIFIVFLFTVFPVLMNTARGVREVDPNLVEVARAFCTNERQMWRHLVLPSALPYVVTGFRLAIGRGLVGVVIAEFYTAISGLGYVIVSNANTFETERVFVVVVTLMLLGVLLTKVVELIEKRISPWKVQEGI